MRNTLGDRLMRRELATDGKRYSRASGIYGDMRWVRDLDVVNELGGHTGCVNALSWSRSGRLLASGSDDHRINIHAYHPESTTSQFSLTTSILTGHQTNIFSVKFMPYSNDRTIVSATDNVRIFDIEHSGHSASRSAASSGSRAASRYASIHRLIDGVTLTEGDTNAKVFRSHNDTVKRIVTEDSPFFFLTCSEDGDVRQWDIRQPARYYPPLRDNTAPTWATDNDAVDDVPKPLISYSRYRLDLNTVSCSPSQPHYIALGGAHLHCFLHDRRMLGRDRFDERGAKLAAPDNWTINDDEILRQATQCVKKFAPNGQQRMGRRDNGHITACKISDANPNELVVSWSGDHIYSFDMARSPDATDTLSETKTSSSAAKGHPRDQNRKRKLSKTSKILREAAEPAGSRQRTESSEEDLALRVNYGNGQSEEIRIESPRSPVPSKAPIIDPSSDHYRIAQTVTKIQHRIFVDRPEDYDEPARQPASKIMFTSILGFTACILPDIDDAARSWRYPMNPTELDVAVQNKLRERRASCRRFVQAAGTLARVLGARLQTGGDGTSVIAQYFASVQMAPSERGLPRHEQFGYDFLKAILLWLDSGLGAVIRGFSSASRSARHPIPADADTDAIDEILIPYLLQFASDKPIVNVDASVFESDDTRVLFSSEKAAVTAFAHALHIPFADLVNGNPGASEIRLCEDDEQDRPAAVYRWAFQVGRGLLLNASSDIRFAYIDQAFGGPGVADASIQAQEGDFLRRQHDIDTDDNFGGILSDMTPDMRKPTLLSSTAAPEDDAASAELATTPASSSRVDNEARNDTDENAEWAEEEMDDDDGEDDDMLSRLIGDADDDEGEGADDDGLSRTRSGRMLWQSDFDRSALRERVESHVPAVPHTRVFAGHCNVRTVKDVNFFGQQDEYVVSGSDCGHVFIWDRKSGQLVNILKGDKDVVNVVQGHPYEPTMAVSGIDRTIKIFSPDANEQQRARKGITVQSQDPGESGISFLGRRRTQRSAESSSVVRQRSDSSDDDDDQVANDGLASRKAMHEQYQITSQNDMDRKGGREDAYVTRALLAQIAQGIRARQAAGEEDGEGGTIYVDENEECTMM